MKRWAIVRGGVVDAVIEQDSQPVIPGATVVDVTNLLTVGPGMAYDGVNFTIRTAPGNRRLTKRAFMNRFPLSANGVSRKYDVMTLFLTNDAYGATLIADAATRQALQLLVLTGLNRLNASEYVDLDLTEASSFTQLMMDGSIPAAFRLSSDERNTVLSTTVLDSERWLP